MIPSATRSPGYLSASSPRDLAVVLVSTSSRQLGQAAQIASLPEPRLCVRAHALQFIVVSQHGGRGSTTVVDEKSGAHGVKQRKGRPRSRRHATNQKHKVWPCPQRTSFFAALDTDTSSRLPCSKAPWSFLSPPKELAGLDAEHMPR